MQALNEIGGSSCVVACRQTVRESKQGCLEPVCAAYSVQQLECFALLQWMVLYGRHHIVTRQITTHEYEKYSEKEERQLCDQCGRSMPIRRSRPALDRAQKGAYKPNIQSLPTLRSRLREQQACRPNLSSPQARSAINRCREPRGCS